MLCLMIKMIWVQNANFLWMDCVTMHMFKVKQSFGITYIGYPVIRQQAGDKVLSFLVFYQLESM